ncbi:MAG: DUF6328 family protein [Nocardioidaceae bacterium]
MAEDRALRMGESGEESHEERINRNWDEMLQELRVTQTGVQILTGFLLTLPFQQRFPELDSVQRTAYLMVLAGAVLAVSLMIAPVSYHRLLFRQGAREWLVKGRGSGGPGRASGAGGHDLGRAVDGVRRGDRTTRVEYRRHTGAGVLRRTVVVGPDGGQPARHHPRDPAIARVVTVGSGQSRFSR